MAQRYDITADTPAPSKLEAEARRPSPFEALPLLELGSTALGAILGVAVGYNSGAPDITRYVVNGTILGASLPIVAVVVYSGALTAYSWSKHLTYTMERWSQRDLTGDGIIGEPPGERWLTIRGGYAAPSEPVENMTMAEFVRLCSEHSTAWQSYWRPMGKISQTEWETKRNILIGAQKAEWINPEFPNSGWRLTASADTIIRQLGK